VLQTRLRFLAIGIGVLAIPLGVVAATIGAFGSIRALFVDPPLLGYPFVWGTLVLAIGLTVLSPRVPREIGTLRALEVGFFGSGALLYAGGWAAVLLRLRPETLAAAAGRHAGVHVAGASG